MLPRVRWVREGGSQSTGRLKETPISSERRLSGRLLTGSLKSHGMVKCFKLAGKPFSKYLNSKKKTGKKKRGKGGGVGEGNYISQAKMAFSKFLKYKYKNEHVVINFNTKPRKMNHVNYLQNS